MTFRYEVNPPKITPENISQKDMENSLDELKKRVQKISNSCNGIHITDSVLGIPRVSPTTLASLIREDDKKIEITTSLRVRDRNLTSLTQLVSDAIIHKVNGILILKGDAPPKGPQDSGLVPSQVVKKLKEIGFGKDIEFFLSIPNNPDFDKISKKIESEPAGFITQVIHCEDQVQRIVDKLKPQGFKIIPCILLPSEKNTKSAEFLGLDWSNYKENVVEFIIRIRDLAGNVLITSPNDFSNARKILNELSH
jgi:5,10-methylenetetrahydrofolate reductase